MSEDQREMTTDDPFFDDDDIEILEVVGVDDDAPPPDADVEDAVTAEAQAEDRPPAPPGAEVSRERLLRLQADFENFRKRVDRERGAFERHARAGLVERLLPILDNLERALALEHESEVYDPFRDGVSLIHRQLLDELRKAGLRPVDSVGRPFDPNVHEAVLTEPSADVAPHTVLEEIQRGYRFLDRLLRPARVKVSVEPERAIASGEDGEES